MAKPTQPPRRTAKRARGPGSTGKLLLGLVLGIALTLSGIAAYFYFGKPPVAVTDRSALWEHPLHSIPLGTRMAADAREPPFPASEDAFEAGARTYRAQCASCHGTPGRESALGKSMAPRAQQFFSVRDRKSTAAQSPGELYWKSAFGLRRSGMPAYNHTLTETQLWQTSLLLHSANDDLPDPVRNLLTAPDSPAGQPRL